MTFKSFLKSLTKLTFQRGNVGGGTAPPFFGNDFDLWDRHFGDGQKKINFSNEVGDLRGSALLMAAYQWLSDGLSAPRLTVVKLGADNEETEIRDHPLVQLFDQPNPYYGSEELLSGIALDWLIHATAYIVKVHSAGGRTVELYYWPWSDIRPVWPEDGKTWISGYEINVNGQWTSIDTDNVLVLRKGVDMATRMGQSATSALIREYYTDQQAAQFGALLMKQGLIPPLLISLGNEKQSINEDQAKIVKASIIRQMSGTSAGAPVVTSAPANVNLLNFDYSKMGLRDVRAMTEERFCAAMKISPYSLHFGTSRQASTFSNVESYLKYDYRAYVVPMHKYIAKRFARELLSDFGDTQNLQVRWNYEQVPLMQADLTVEWRRVAEAYKARILDQSEAREAIGYKSDDSHLGVYYPVNSQWTTENDLDVSEPSEPMSIPTFTDQMPAKASIDEGGTPSERELEDGLNWWEINAPREARGLARAKPLVKPNGQVTL